MTLPWENDVRRKLAVDLEPLGAEELRLEVKDLRDLAVDMCEVLRTIIEPEKLSA
jgi:hypothetical protein